ncbi:hypothetical protein CEXT_148431 [Caerostris extrusa]|uniref:Uncharacterized protein n=1 Tax=Caerostris extrusa TaxID=172846 RepID=A0AAV4XNT6_CAEEX|nr:hypothetical protein CEXT_148431 [Caerostris extrusa]
MTAARLKSQPDHDQPAQDHKDQKDSFPTEESLCEYLEEPWLRRVTEVVPRFRISLERIASSRFAVAVQDLGKFPLREKQLPVTDPQLRLARYTMYLPFQCQANC